MKSNKITFLVVIILLGITAYFIYTKKAGTIRTELRDFAVQDTASITKIFIADRKGYKTTLERTAEKTWTVNGKYTALPKAVNILLETIKKVEVRSPVGKAAYNSVIKDLGTDGTKVEIYAGDKNIKTYYVGQPTQDMLGTFMFIENSTTPFVTHIPGFNGFLSTRFTAKPDDWKSKIILAYNDAALKEITVVDPKDSVKSFKVKKTENDFQLFSSPASTVATDIFKSKIAAYINHFIKLPYEYEETLIKKDLKDSILSTTPYKTLEVLNVNGKMDKIIFYRKPPVQGTLTSNDPETGKLRPFDPDRMFVIWNTDTNFYAVQYFVWEPVFKNPELIRGF
ncbi:MAG TPA: DUF4340 domain-containing protein [Bacteroidia bacterium]|nr:DUF4340 domain-containing protein [Bacteroidia bacterium]HNU31986.1 DUF4340 domain-containing protein [Bacteroidia bacterium]